MGRTRKQSEASASKAEPATADQASCVEIALPDNLDLLSSADLKSQLLGEIGDHRSVRLDASAVEFASTACVQVLVSALGHYTDKGVAIGISGDSEKLAHAFHSLGLEQDFERWRLAE